MVAAFAASYFSLPTSSFFAVRSVPLESFASLETFTLMTTSSFSNVNKISYLPYGTRKKLFRYIFVYFYLCLKTIYLYFKIRPKYIVTTGTHTAGPMCYLGKLFGSKIIYIETFANRNRKTATGRLIYPIADLFIVQWEEQKKVYPKAINLGSIF